MNGRKTSLQTKWQRQTERILSRFSNTWLRQALLHLPCLSHFSPSIYPRPTHTQVRCLQNSKQQSSLDTAYPVPIGFAPLSGKCSTEPLQHEASSHAIRPSTDSTKGENEAWRVCAAWVYFLFFSLSTVASTVFTERCAWDWASVSMTWISNNASVLLQYIVIFFWEFLIIG